LEGSKQSQTQQRTNALIYIFIYLTFNAHNIYILEGPPNSRRRICFDMAKTKTSAVLIMNTKKRELCGGKSNFQLSKKGPLVERTVAGKSKKIGVLFGFMNRLPEL